MAGNNRSDWYKLNYAKRKFTDEDLDQLPLKNKEYSYQEVDFSANELSSTGLRVVLDLCHCCPKLRVLKLFRNHLDDVGAEDIARLVRKCPTLEEMHLSHNRFTADGVAIIIRAAEQSRPRDAPPMWLRLEQNAVENAAEVLRDMQGRFSVCERRDEKVCTPRVCCYGKKVHLPFFHLQKNSGQGRDGRSPRREEGGARKKIILTARTDTAPQKEESELGGYDSRSDDGRKDRIEQEARIDETQRRPMSPEPARRCNGEHRTTHRARQHSPRGRERSPPLRPSAQIPRSDRTPRGCLRTRSPPQRDIDPMRRRIRRRRSPEMDHVPERVSDRGHPFHGERRRVSSCHGTRQVENNSRHNNHSLQGQRRRPRSLVQPRMADRSPMQNVRRRRLTEEERARLRDKNAAPTQGHQRERIPAAPEYGAAFGEPVHAAVTRPVLVSDAAACGASSGSSSGSSSSADPAAPAVVGAYAADALAVGPTVGAGGREATAAKGLPGVGATVVLSASSDDEAYTSEDGEPAGVPAVAGPVTEAAPVDRPPGSFYAEAPRPSRVNRSEPRSEPAREVADVENFGKPPGDLGRPASPSPSCSETRWREDRGCSPPAIASPGQSRSRSRRRSGGGGMPSPEQKDQTPKAAGQARSAHGSNTATAPAAVKERMETLKERLMQKWQGKQTALAGVTE